jgi:sulfatase modifying factor 1
MTGDHPILDEYGLGGSVDDYLSAGRDLLRRGESHLAATALDRAFGLAADNQEVVAERAALLNKLTVDELGLRFRYVPAGTFLMGSEDGDPDERPQHPVRTGQFWLSETTVSWARYCQLMNWTMPPHSFPPEAEVKALGRDATFALYEANKIRLQYCEDATKRARNWHSHAEGEVGSNGDTKSFQEFFGAPDRDDPNLPFQYDQKPMVSVAWQDVDELCETLVGRPSWLDRLRRGTEPGVVYRLPTEAEWEKAARGGLIGCRYAWGNDEPSETNCDFNRFEAFSILTARSFPPNGYGLFAVCGSVWEWTSTAYDSDAYRNPVSRPISPDQPRVLRGGSWADCAEAVTVSFRMPRLSKSWREVPWGGHMSPNIGFRICRVGTP